MSSALSGATSPDSSRPSAGTGLRGNRANRFPSRFIGCQRRTVTAAFDGNSITSALNAPGTHYVARIRNNALLKRLAVPAIDALASEALDRLGDRDRCGTWSCELDKPYRAPPRTTRRCLRPPGKAGRAGLERPVRTPPGMLAVTISVATAEGRPRPLLSGLALP